MRPFINFQGSAAPLLIDDVNTDQIAPVQFMRTLEPDYEKALFGRWRAQAMANSAQPFVLDLPRFKRAPILVAGANFGCGSAREAAVWALAAHGVRCVIARSFADVFRESLLKNGMLPVRLADADQAAFEQLVLALDGEEPLEIDLSKRTITGPRGSPAFPFEIGAAERSALLQGLDDVAVTLQRCSDIEAWEARTRASHPWLQTPYSTS